MNDYYDVNIKHYRLNELSKFNNFIFIRLIVQNEDDHKEIFYDIYVLDENGNDTEHSMINVQRPFKRLVDKLDYLIKLDY